MIDFDLLNLLHLDVVRDELVVRGAHPLATARPDQQVTL